MEKSVVICGLPGSGKTSVSRFLGSLGYFYMSAGKMTGEFIRNALSLDVEPIGRKSLQEAGDYIVSNKMEYDFAEFIISEMENHEIVVVDGVRLRKTVERIKQRKNVNSFFLDVHRDVAVKRIMSRDSLSKKKSEDILRKRIEVLSIDTKTVCNHIIDANLSVDSVCAKIVSLL